MRVKPPSKVVRFPPGELQSGVIGEKVDEVVEDELDLDVVVVLGKGYIRVFNPPSVGVTVSYHEYFGEKLGSGVDSDG